ncbi:MAG: hypothetical protein WCK21_04235 [Actinomycetota bacterium]
MNPTRRQLLVAGAAAGSAALLAACGDDKGSGTKVTNPGDTTPPAQRSDSESLPNKFALVQRFPQQPSALHPGAGSAAAGVDHQTERWPARQRPGHHQGVGRGPQQAEGRRPRGHPPLRRHHQRVLGRPRAAAEGGATFEVFDATDVDSPDTGTPMPPFDTPTKDNHRGVEPYCTLAPQPCPFHQETLADALKSGKPVAYMVGTPAHCTTGTCSPGLQFLVAESTRVGDKMVCVHADVYTNNEATDVAPAVAALGVQYEPIIYFIDTTGTIVDRLDGIWDKSELRERVDLLLA